MSEDTTNPAPEVEQTAPEVGQGADAQDFDAEAIDDLLPDGEEVEEVEEVEYEGKQYKVPRDIKDALLRQADYTRKTQEVAQQRAAVELHQQQLRAAAEMQQAFAQDYASLVGLQTQLARYEGIDWTKLSEDDPVLAQKAFFEFSRLKDQVGQTQQQLQQRQQQALSQHREAHGRLVEEGRRAIAREIKGWSPELGEQLVEYYVKEGGSEGEIRSTVSPLHLKLVHKARLYDQLMAKAASKSRSGEAAAEPTPTVQGRATSSPNPSRMGTEEWMRWRNKQLAKR